MSDHTPTPNLGLPWYADQDQREGYEWNVHVVEHNNPNMRICFMANGPDSVERAAHLVKAVNSHDALTECLQSIADMSDQEPREPDDADWRFRCLSAIEVAKRVIASLKERA